MPDAPRETTEAIARRVLGRYGQPLAGEEPTDEELAAFNDRTVMEGPCDPRNPAAQIVPTDREVIPLLTRTIARGTSLDFQAFIELTLLTNHIAHKLGMPSLAAKRAAAGECEPK